MTASGATGEQRPVSRWRVIGSAAIVVALLSVVLPLMNPALEARAIGSVGWLPALLTAHLVLAVRAGAIRQRFTRSGFGETETRDGGFSIAIFNPPVLTVRERPSQFQSYVMIESFFAFIAWVMVAGPALSPLLRAIS
jgi:hypothetical protein